MGNNISNNQMKIQKEETKQKDEEQQRQKDEQFLQLLSQKRCAKIHDIIESSEIKFFVNDLGDMDDELIKMLQKDLCLPNGWIDFEPQKRASLFRTHIYKNGKMGTIDIFEKEISALSLEVAWDLYLFFYPTAERNNDFFVELKDYDAFLQSWKWRYDIRVFDNLYKTRVDLLHCFGNVALFLKRIILENKEYYLKNKYLSQMLILNQDKSSCFSIIQKDVIFLINKSIL